MLSSEVLPAPLGPMIDRMPPRGTSSDTSCTAVTPPNFLDTPSTTSWPSPRRAEAPWTATPIMTSSLRRSVSSVVAGIMQGPQCEGNKGQAGACPTDAAACRATGSAAAVRRFGSCGAPAVGENRRLRETTTRYQRGGSRMSEHYDRLETRRPEEREAALMQALPGQIAHAKANAPFFKAWLREVDPAAVTSRAALARLPVLRKSKLGEVQKKDLPMGGLLAVPLEKARHIFMSPGPIFEIDVDQPDYFRGARAMHAAGFRAGDV